MHVAPMEVKSPLYPSMYVPVERRHGGRFCGSSDFSSFVALGSKLEDLVNSEVKIQDRKAREFTLVERVHVITRHQH